jgi:hypothetical protein
VSARWLFGVMSLLTCCRLFAADSVIAGASADHLRDGTGGSASLLWLRSDARGTRSAGATFVSFPSTRWAYATLGASRPFGTRTHVALDANLGRGTDDSGGFRYLLLRGGVTQELLAKRLYGEAELLHADVARRRNDIARLGATFVQSPQLTLRGSVYQSFAGDDDTTLITARGDYDFGRATAIAGFSAGHATPVLLEQRGGETTHVHEAFDGVAIHAWTIIATAGEDRQRISLSWRIPLPEKHQ